MKKSIEKSKEFVVEVEFKIREHYKDKYCEHCGNYEENDDIVTSLRFYNNSVIRKVLDLIVNDFNAAELERYYDKICSKDLISIRAKSNYEKGLIEVTFLSKKFISDKFKKALKDYLNGQLSDGWGEGFEQQEQYNLIYDCEYCYIQPICEDSTKVPL